MGKKRKHAEVVKEEDNELAEEVANEWAQLQGADEAHHDQEQLKDQDQHEVQASINQEGINQANIEKEVEQFKPQRQGRQNDGFQNRNRNKNRYMYSRVAVDPSRNYHTPESRESWGPNVKGKKFRKEKTKKKRCPNAGIRIDGSVKSVRLDF